MGGEMIIILLTLVVFLLATAFCSASETGLTVASKSNLHKLAGEGKKGAEQALNLRKNQDRLIGTLLLGNNAMNTAISVVGANALAHYIGEDELGIFIITSILTVVILLFGEVLPKVYAFGHSDRVAVLVAPVWSKLIYVFYPITKLIENIAMFILRILGQKSGTKLFDPLEEIRGAIEMHHEEGAVIKDDRDMLGSILDLSQIEVGDVMVHRRDIFSLNIDLAPKLLVDTAIENGHSRFPIWEKTEENIIGILHSKDLLKLNISNVSRSDIVALLKDPMFIPETTSLRDQMEKFRQRRTHLAIVVDEYGALMGLITLEDILEEIVGQIDDEHDTVVKGIKSHLDGTYTVRGNINIRDLNRELNWHLPNEEDAHTIAGFVIKLAEDIPEVGDKFSIEGFEFTVTGKLRNQITGIKIKETFQEPDEQE